MLYVIDHYDSFVYNLVSYVEELGEAVCVRQPHPQMAQELQQLQPDGILLSPGPMGPADAADTLQLLASCYANYPIFGVCLGHQILAHFFGATVQKGSRPFHGKLSPIVHTGRDLFQGIPQHCVVTRYHSLSVCKDTLPPCLAVTAQTADGTVMGISHKSLPIFGVQFHPEAVCSEYGHTMVENFLQICRRRQQS